MRSEPPVKSTAIYKASKRNEIVIAIIGLLGVLATAFFSNYDKIFPPANLVRSTFSDYTPTEEPLVEARIFHALTGKKESLKRQREAMSHLWRRAIEDQMKLNPDQSAEMMQWIDHEIKSWYQDMLEEDVRIRVKYFSISQLQELNKFYSTPIMRQMMKKQPLIDKEYGEFASKFMDEFRVKMDQKYKELINSPAR